MSSLSFSSDLVRGVHARISHARGHFSCLAFCTFARWTTEKRETACSLCSREIYFQSETKIEPDLRLGEFRDTSGRSYFPRLVNLSINDFLSAISHWFTVAEAARKLRSTHSKNFYKELDSFSTAFMNKMKRI